MPRCRKSRCKRAKHTQSTRKAHAKHTQSTRKAHAKGGTNICIIIDRNPKTQHNDDYEDIKNYDISPNCEIDGVVQWNTEHIQEYRNFKEENEALGYFISFHSYQMENAGSVVNFLDTYEWNNLPVNKDNLCMRVRIPPRLKSDKENTLLKFVTKMVEKNGR